MDWQIASITAGIVAAAAAALLGFWWVWWRRPKRQVGRDQQGTRSASHRDHRQQPCLVAVARHALADHRAVQDVEHGKQRRCAVPDIIVGHRFRPPLLHRQTRLAAVERLNLRFLVDRQHQAVRRRIEIEPDHVAQFGGKTGSCDSLNRRTRCGCRPCAAQIRCTERSEMPVAAAIARPVQCVASPGGSARVSSTTRSICGGNAADRTNLLDIESVQCNQVLR